MNAPGFKALTTSKDLPDEETTIELAETLIDARLGPILRCVEGGTDPRPSLRRSYSTFIQQTSFLSDNGYDRVDVTGGSGTTRSEAKLAALGEAIERYSLSIHQRSDLKQAPYTDLDDAVPPDAVIPFSDKQREDRNLSEKVVRDTPIDWTQATHLVTGEKNWVPAQAVYLPFDPEIVLRSPNTSGAAAGLDHHTACRRAVTELVERECFMIGYLNKLSYPHIDLSSASEDSWLDRLQRVMQTDRRELHVMDASLDQPYETAIAILVDRTENPPISFGLGCSNRMRTAVIDAILEVFQIHEWMIENIVTETFDEDIGTIRDLEDRGRVWNNHAMLDEMDFWLESEESVPIETDGPTGFSAFRQFLKQNSYDCYITDVTSSDIDRAGFTVVCAFSTALFPLYLDEQRKYKGTDRLYDVPVRCNFQSTPTDESALNPVPHPML